MAFRIAVLLGLSAAVVGCSPHHARERPFSREWGVHIKGERAFEQRKARIDGKDNPLAGDEGGTRAAIVTDEKGDAKLNIGRRNGLSADLDYGRGPEGRVKYKREFDWGRPR